eukprot:GEZU01003053.1.p1 GENE.GEZU01003053.1~~GEZU01003053.1.p1  ORF type:complete len:157 (-),score=20.54 GEZU01003053.1:23-493(-)
MTCHGMSTSAMAACLAIHGDSEHGLLLPPRLARYQVVIVPVVMKKGDLEPVTNKSRQLETELRRAGIRCFVDGSGDKKPGEKYYYWEMKGVPVRYEVGPRDVANGQVCIVRRDTGEKKLVPDADVLTETTRLMNEIFDRMKSASETLFKASSSSSR